MANSILGEDGERGRWGEEEEAFTSRREGRLFLFPPPISPSHFSWEKFLIRETSYFPLPSSYSRGRDLFLPAFSRKEKDGK